MLCALQIKHKCNVFFNRQFLKQMEILEHEANVAATVIVKIIFCKFGKTLVFKKDLAGIKAVKSAKQIEQR